MKVPGKEEELVRGRERRARRLSRALTNRQKEVLAMLAHGRRIKQIAHHLGISERTVKLHRTEMIRKLSAETNTEAIRIAVRAII